MRSFFSCSPAARTAAIIPKIACLGVALAKTGKSPQPELPLQQSRLHGGSLRTGTGYTGSLPAREGDFVNEVLASGGATRFPRYEDMGRDKAADGRGGVAQEGSGLLHGNPSRGFDQNSRFQGATRLALLACYAHPSAGGLVLKIRFHGGMIAQEKRECRKFLQKNAHEAINNNAHNAHARE